MVVRLTFSLVHVRLQREERKERDACVAQDPRETG